MSQYLEFKVLNSHDLFRKIIKFKKRKGNLESEADICVVYFEFDKGDFSFYNTTRKEGNNLDSLKSVVTCMLEDQNLIKFQVQCTTKVSKRA